MNTEITYHNPDNVPADKIPPGWRLLVTEEVGPLPMQSCRLWLPVESEFTGECFSNGGARNFTYITSADRPLPEKYRAVVEASPLDRQEGGEHYKSCKVQPITFIHANNLNFLEGSIIKRVCRHRRKNGAEDLRKAIHELELMLELEYNEKP